MSRPASTSRAGFTLIELLVASAIMITLVLIVAKVAVDTLNAYDRVVADLSTQAEARAVLDNMERDFNTAVIRPDGRCWMEIIAPKATSSEASGLSKLANIAPDLQPVVMFFAAPGDRPRWTTSGGVRTAVPGETSAICYRLGRRSPFDLPGSTIQQIYCFQRTIIDAQNTFNEAIPLLTVPTGALSAVVTGTPFTYWGGVAVGASNTLPTSPIVRAYISPYGTNITTGLPLIGPQILANSIDGTTREVNAPNTNGGWTMDENNFCAQNIVGLGVTLWCASSETATVDKARRGQVVNMPPAALRPVVCSPTSDVATFGADSNRGGANTTGVGIKSAYGGIMGPSSAVPGTATVNSDYYSYRARVYSDRIQIDTVTAPLPYTLRQVEVSVTVLTPAGARELRSLQAAQGIAQGLGTTGSVFRRVVTLNSRSYSRRMIVLGSGN